MSETKFYEAQGFAFNFMPNGTPYAGLLRVTDEVEHGPYAAEVNLSKAGSRKLYAQQAAELCHMDAATLKRALNEVFTLRLEEVAAATAAEEETEEPEPEPMSQEAEALVSTPGVLDRYVEDAARVHGIVGDRKPLALQTLVSLGAQIEPFPNGRPVLAGDVIIGEPSRGKNYLNDAVAALLPDEFCLPFDSSSAKALFYRAENDPGILRHVWAYPNEVEATDLLVEMFRPLLSGGKVRHLTVNKDGDGRNVAQELTVEGPITVTIPTVRNKLDTQLQTRLLVAELEDYEGRIAEHSRALSKQLWRDRASEDHTPKVRAWQAALRSLTVIRRVVFDLDRKEFCFDSDQVSHGARLWGNLLGLMVTHAWLEQRNREVVKLASGEQAIVATPEDYERAYDIFKATCERSVVNLSDTHRKILDAVYELKEQSSFTDGYSLRKIAEKASIHHSTVAEHKTYLTKSAKLLREVEGGLDLVSDAEPSWWRKGDLLVGFPRPEQVWRWWKEGEPSASESTRQARHSEDEDDEPHTYAEKPVGHSTRQREDTTRQSTSDDGLSGAQSSVSDEGSNTENRLFKPQTDHEDRASGVSGGFEEGGIPLCIHDFPGGKGCYLCDPNHPYRLTQGGIA